MSIRFQADNDLKAVIVDATRRREPGIGFQTAQSAGLDRLDDETVLRLAASQGRILVTHDKRTMPLHVLRNHTRCAVVTSEKRANSRIDFARVTEPGYPPGP